jgi:hypothetical protein
MTTPKHSNEPLRVTLQDSSKTSVTKGLADLATLARQAFEEKRRKESLALARAILKIDPDNQEAQVMERWIRLDLGQNLEIARTVARDAYLKSSFPLYERAETMVRAVLDVDPDHEEARAFLSDLSKGRYDSPVAPVVKRDTAHVEALKYLEERLKAVDQYDTPLTSRPAGFRSKGAIVLFALAIIVVAWLIIRRQGGTTAGSEVVTPRLMGILDVVTDEGVQVFVNDEDRGLAPIKPLTLAPGVYRLKYKVNGEEIASEGVAVTAGSTAHNSTRQFAGRLMLIVVPKAGVQLSVDNKGAGPVPPYLDLTPGEHRLAFTAGGYEPETRSASVKAGRSEVIPILMRPSSGNSSPARNVPVTKTGNAKTDASARTAPPAETGTLAVSSVLPMDIYSGDKYLGSTPTTLTLPPGTHDFEFRYGNLRKTGTYTTRSGYNTTATVMFDVTVQVNARPWAEVFVDGNPAKALGQTPLGSVSVPVGGTLVFRNPNFPEKKYRVAATDTTIQVVFP